MHARAKDSAKEKMEVGGGTLLHIVDRCGQKDLVELLIENDIDVNSEDDSGQTPKDLAEVRDYIEIVELLREHRAN